MYQLPPTPQILAPASFRSQMTSGLLPPAMEPIGYYTSTESLCGLLGARPANLLIVDLPDSNPLEPIMTVRKISQISLLAFGPHRVDPTLIAAIFDAGADGLLRHPVNGHILCSKMRRMLARAKHTPSLPTATILEFPGVTIDLTANTVATQNNTFHLTPLERKLVEMLAINPHKVFSTEDILQCLYGKELRDPTTSSQQKQKLRSVIMRLRQKMRHGAADFYINAKNGLGYRWMPNNNNSKGNEDGVASKPTAGQPLKHPAGNLK